MKSRWALGVLGAWLMGSLLMFMVAPTNFRLIDELLAHSSNASFHALVERDGPATARELLRYLASELNRTFFLRWNITQAALGAALIYLLPRPVRDRWSWGLALAATGIALVLLVALTPLITSLGRSLDFVPRTPAPPGLARFQLLHVGYTALELVKVGCLGVVFQRLVRGERAAAPAAGAAPTPEGQRA
ncbi:MAG TPA: hypothetical protein VNN80_11890 [Polyangiaceae bacterium]|nr:hypothetical protein [Polyangiaceae bacterium]